MNLNFTRLSKEDKKWTNIYDCILILLAVVILNLLLVTIARLLKCVVILCKNAK